MTKGVQQIDADTALKFVRSRHSDVNGSDFGRSLRQMAFLKGVVNKLKTLGGLTKLPYIVSKINTFLITDINIQNVINMATTYGDPFSFSIKTLPLTVDNILVASTSANGQFILVPKDDGSDHPIRNFIDTSIEQFIASQSATTATPVPKQ
jgi:anionic cell wall polymer biosynthesis LytR-Cps2A-Psr (LCP) family protein